MEPFDTLHSCIEEAAPKSFYLLAGAGSGKTYALVNVASKALEDRGLRLKARGQKIAIISYTNAACDEIKQRLKFDSLVETSTIHSYCWSLISPFTKDIADWLATRLTAEIVEIKQAQAKGRGVSKASEKRNVDLGRKTRRLDGLGAVRQFSYSPSGENSQPNSLSHAEVIAAASHLLLVKPVLGRLLVSRNPILFIDECQDTQGTFIEALLQIQSLHQRHFCLGLFGDSMQRIYLEGKRDLPEAVPQEWQRPAIPLNRRSGSRIVDLINCLRSDGHQQIARTDAPLGWVQLFLVQNPVENKQVVEKRVAERMGEITGCQDWGVKCKQLILEHHMAATRLGFSRLFQALYEEDSYRTGLLDGSLPTLRFFTDQVSALIEQLTAGNRMAGASIVRRHSPLVSSTRLLQVPEQMSSLKAAKNAADRLTQLWRGTSPPTLNEVIDEIYHTGLFELPEPLHSIAASRSAGDKSPSDSNLSSMAERQQKRARAWIEALSVPFSQVDAYKSYVTDSTQFGTHQGVKGLEFSHVAVIIDDSDSRGFLFSYDKLFGTKPKSSADHTNEKEGSETSLERTQRLLYVTCSRAKESLAVIAYTSNPAIVAQQALSRGWFHENEITLV